MPVSEGDSDIARKTGGIPGCPAVGRTIGPAVPALNNYAAFDCIGLCEVVSEPAFRETTSGRWVLWMGEAVVDYLQKGDGPIVVLIHSSVAGAGQWRRLMDDLSDQFHLIAINLYGYGGTRAWRLPREQTLQDQAELLHEILPDRESRFSIVGHSFGGSVAMKAAALFGDRVERLVLIEPNPFYLLALSERANAFAEAKALRDCIKENGGKGNWEAAAAVFADYWTGDGSWDAMPEERRVKFAQALKPNFHEWDAVMNESTTLSQWVSKLPRQTTVISASDTVNSINQIVELMKQACTEWRFEQLERGGHMAPLTEPDRMNPKVADALR